MREIDPDLAMPSFDLAEARRLLDASGSHPRTGGSTLTYNSVSEEYKNIAKVFQRNLAKIGVRLTLHPGPWGMIWSEAKNLRTAPHAFLMIWWPTYPSLADWLTGLFRTEEAGAVQPLALQQPGVRPAGRPRERRSRRSSATPRSRSTGGRRRSWSRTRRRSSSVTSTIA